MRFSVILSVIVSSTLSLAATEEEILRQGQYLYNLSGCANCHTADKAKPLAGGVGIPTPFGTFYAPNISMDKKTGIGNWTDEQFIKAMREGVSPKGENYFPVFPYTSYSKLSDQDILAIKKYISTRPTFEQTNKKHEASFPYNNRTLVGAWKLLNFSYLKNVTKENFFQSKGAFRMIESEGLEWNRGAYLVEGALHCAQCHTPRDGRGGFVWKKWMGGSAVSGSDDNAPNITPDKKALGDWKQEDWQSFLTEGTTIFGTEVSGEMKKIIKTGTSKLTEKDLQAVIKYLMSLKPVAD